MELPPRTQSYIAALVRDGAAFDYEKWRAASTATNQKVAPDPATPVTHSRIGSRPSDLSQPSGATIVASRVAGRRPCPLTIRRRQHAFSPRSLVRQDLKRLSDVWGDVQGNRQRDAVHGYLQEVFRVVRRYRQTGRLKRLVRGAREMAGTTIRRSRAAYAIVIRATAGGAIDRKAISRYARVLKAARRHKRRGQSLKAFIKASGGLNACAGLYARRRRRRSPRCR